MAAEEEVTARQQRHGAAARIQSLYRLRKGAEEASERRRRQTHHLAVGEQRRRAGHRHAGKQKRHVEANHRACRVQTHVRGFLAKRHSARLRALKREAVRQAGSTQARLKGAKAAAAARRHALAQEQLQVEQKRQQQKKAAEEAHRRAAADAADHAARAAEAVLVMEKERGKERGKEREKAARVRSAGEHNAKFAVRLGLSKRKITMDFRGKQQAQSQAQPQAQSQAEGEGVDSLPSSRLQAVLDS